mmetsp:Transcript_12251/g.41062  ORF Transcript_12251/g.41062 Transcript_12251/m.41062 type:complete len:314 (-) Transcript_12251:480-1421(-)
MTAAVVAEAAAAVAAAAVAAVAAQAAQAAQVDDCIDATEQPAAPAQLPEACEEQGPNALSGAAAAAEEAEAQERLLRPHAGTPERRPSLGSRLRRAFAALVVLPDPQEEEEEAHGPELQLTRTHSGAECAICLATLGSCVETPCGHAFHAACLEHYFATSLPGQRPRCPYCRSSVHAPLPVEARAVSGLPLEPVAAPRRGGLCHFDRHYRFLDLGDFGRAGMLYLLSSNEDRKTASSAVMWVVEARVPCTIHLNYRSARHVAEGRQEEWLRAKGFAPNGALRSAVSSGVPNGPYSGPVYSNAPPARVRAASVL